MTIVLPERACVLEELVEEFGDERRTARDERDGVGVFGPEARDEGDEARIESEHLRVLVSLGPGREARDEPARASL